LCNNILTYLGLTNFVENIYVNKVNLIDDTKLKSLIADQGQKKEITTFDYKDLDVTLISLSSKSHVELFVKDFAKSYEHSLTVYQNDIGFYDKVSIVSITNLLICFYSF